ncbi:hypothetical protein DXG03_002940 [Asterophora parasitica]|uniref:Uncharacterized protein n=1 Tax=Asterophora parasitica TaxID=117018 RepID=A0A9P7G810_9AGAR|nr:hypothetical protein DXG03_002940 [Asterophora parasitica]
MTEYDYSPEGYERYMQTQNRIANWVNQTEQHRPEFRKEGKPSFFQRLTHRRRSHSVQEPLYSKSPRSPGPMPIPSFQAMYPQVQAAPPKPSKHSSSRRRSSSHHQSSRRPVYVTSPPTSPPVNPYAYPYGTTMTPGQVVSPGAYVYPTQPGYSAVSTPAYMQPSGSYFPQPQPQTSYPFPTTYAQPRISQTAPPTIYGQYSQGQTPPAQYPQMAAYPPAIYPLTTYAPQQQLPEKPVFYQRIFSGSGSGKGKKSSRR